MHIQCFTFNPFSENTYLIWDDNRHATIIDPGFYTEEEGLTFLNFIKINNLQLKGCLLTHAHIDHIFGCELIFEKFGIKPRMHLKEEIVYQSADQVSIMYDLKKFKFPDFGEFIQEGVVLSAGNIKFNVLFTPGHSPGSISLYCMEKELVFSGDVLFEGSVGRTDLPGGNHSTLIDSIKSQLLTLPNKTLVYSGHGGITTIGQEKLTNPFL